MNAQERMLEFCKQQKITVYWYEDKPYRVLHEGKLKIVSVMQKTVSLLENTVVTEEEITKAKQEIAKVNNGSQWIDVIVYEPLYEECDIRICVKEKEDFYNNYKIKQ